MHGKGPEVCEQSSGGNVQGTYETIDVLVIEDRVSAKDVERIRKGEISAKGKVIAGDLKFGGATYQQRRRSLRARLGVMPLSIGQHGEFFTTRAGLRRALQGVAPILLGLLVTSQGGLNKESVKAMVTGYMTDKLTASAAKKLLGSRAMGGAAGFFLTMPSDNAKYNEEVERKRAEEEVEEKIRERSSRIHAVALE